MPCKMCKERGKTWTGDNPRCAFDGANEYFTNNNWNCATMNALRARSRELGTNFRDDNAAASIGTIPFEGDDYSGYIVLTWYKDRGQTGRALIMWDDEPPREITEQDALMALQYSERLVENKRKGYF